MVEIQHNSGLPQIVMDKNWNFSMTFQRPMTSRHITQTERNNKITPAQLFFCYLVFLGWNIINNLQIRSWYVSDETKATVSSKFFFWIGLLVNLFERKECAVPSNYYALLPEQLKRKQSAHWHCSSDKPPTLSMSIFFLYLPGVIQT